MSGNQEKLILIEEIPKKPSRENIEVIEDFASRINDLEKRAKNVDFVLDIGKIVVIGIIIIFFIAFLQFIFDARKFYTSVYQEYKTTIESLKTDIEKERDQNLQIQIHQLQKEIDYLQQNQKK